MPRRFVTLTAALCALAALAAPSAASANSAPVCPGKEYTTQRNVPVGLSAGCTDPDGDALSYSIVPNTGPGHGSLIDLNPAGSATYVPAQDYVGDDSFQFTASDGTATSAPTTATIHVVDGTGTNSPPVCPSPHYFVPVGSDTTLTGNCYDADGDGLNYALDSFPSSAIGTLSVVPPASVIFHAVAEGTTTFRYHANDTHVNSNIANVDMTVGPTGGGTFSTGTDPGPGNPAVASITTGSTGAVIVTQVAAPASPDPTLVYLPFQFNITAPSDGELVLAFTLDSAAVPAGQDENSLVVLRDGAAIAPCTGSGLGPDPCVSERSRTASGDVHLVVRSSHASAWNFAYRPQPVRPGKGCGDKNHVHTREDGCPKPAR